MLYQIINRSTPYDEKAIIRVEAHILGGKNYHPSKKNSVYATGGP